LSILFDGGYDLEITGFSTADLDFSLPEEVVKDKAEEIELPDLDVRPVSCEGDLWRIGPHRLYCGNARSVESYETLLGGDRADMVFSDPPYNVPIDGHVSGLGKHRHREFAEASGELTAAEFTAFLRTIFRNCVRFAANGSIHYHCMDWRHIREMLDAADGVYSGFKQLVVWKKQNAGMGTFYRSQHELLFVFKSGTAKHTNNFRLGQTGRYRTNVWEHAGANSFRKGRDRDLAAHATIKPTALVADAILDCSNRGDLILDPFSGSGTTLIAAHKTRRRGAAIELDPLHCDTSIRRLMAASGLDAIREDGARFADLEADLAIGEAVDHG
jgi:DNA modification methylase